MKWPENGITTFDFIVSRFTGLRGALLDWQLYRALYLLTCFKPSSTRNDQKKSTPQYVNDGSSLILSFSKSSFLCCWNLPLNYLHLTHFKVIHLAKELHLVTKKSENLIWLIVMVWSAWATCYDTSVLPTQQLCRIFAAALAVNFHLPLLTF